MSITTRITLLCLVVFGAGFYLFVRSEVEDTKQRYREATEEPLVDFSHLVAQMVADEWEQGDRSLSSVRAALALAKERPILAKIYEFEKKSVDLRIYVTDEEGKVLFDSENGGEVGKDYSQWLDVSRTLRGEYGARSSRGSVNEVSTMFVAAPIIVGGKILGSLTIGKPNTTSNQFILAAQRNIWSLGLTLLGAGGVILTVLALFVSRPLRLLTAYVTQVRDGKRDARPPQSKGEIGNLAHAFEEMREALEGKKYIERYVQTLTHELKSPVTAIKGAVEVLSGEPTPEAQRHFLQNIDREAERIRGLSDQLLVLSSLQSQRSMRDTSQVPLGEVLEEVRAGLHGEMEARRITLHIEVKDECILLGNRFWLTEAVRNVVRNAVDFSPDGGAVIVRGSRDGTTVSLTVEDEGPGIPDWALTKVTDQFFSLPRPRTQRRSSGLGLSIVREVTDLHGASFEIRNRESGGAAVSFVFSV